MILIIDNYDSFAYNLVQYFGEFTRDLVVRRNDDITAEGIVELDPDGIVVSPGPGKPQDAGVSMEVFTLGYPTLGVCLGHQALCAQLGARVGHAPDVVHGKPSEVSHDGRGVFAGLPDPFRAGRYHSLAVDHRDLPDSLTETAWTDDEERVVMAVRHESEPYTGVQFHPESILTDVGKRLVSNFVRSANADELLRERLDPTQHSSDWQLADGERTESPESR